jgi:hypothetical protein
LFKRLILWGRGLKASYLVVLFVILAGAWRLWLMGSYYGWEESDYGNLAMTKGVLDGGFRHFDMNHLPLYYAVSAAVMAVVGNATLASIGVSFVSGVALVGATVLVSYRFFGVGAAWLTGLLLVFQPELALYSASSLREPLYGLLVILALLHINERRFIVASVLAGAAFLTRMDAFLVLAPMLLFTGGLDARKSDRPVWLGAILCVLPMLLIVGLWSIYCHFEHGTYAFWGHSIAVNLETGGTELGGFDLINGTSVAASLFGPVISSKFGLFVLLGWIAGILQTQWRVHSQQRNVAILSVLLLGFWLALGFFGQHEPGHNLYWKWLYGVAPPFILIASAGLLRFVRALPMANLGRNSVLLIALCPSLFSMLRETDRQVKLSAEILGPQIELARWIEAETADDNVMVLDNVPERWLSRRDHSRVLYTWMDLPICEDGTQSCQWTPEQFAQWVEETGVEYILWYGEEWTGAPNAAPWLGDNETWMYGDVTLNPTRSARLEHVDSWVFYEVILR